MPTIFIPYGNAIKFRYETAAQAGTDPIRVGEDILDNYLFPDMKTYYNCDSIELDGKGDVCVRYTTDDTAVKIQVDYDNSTVNLRAVVRNSDEVAVDYQIISASSGTFREFTFDFSDAAYSAGNCYYIELISDDLTTNLFTAGDSGTHETGAGITNLVTSANNTISKSAAQAEAGSFSALVQAPGVPVNNDRFIYANDNAAPVTLVENEIYQATAHVYIPSGSPWVAGNNINLLVNFDGSFGPGETGWTNATIFSQGTADASTTDTWLEIVTVFQCGSVTGGSLVITSDNIPTANNEIYVDTVSISPLSDVVEATSECICIESSHPCTQLLSWTNSSNNLGANFANNIVFQGRYRLYYHQAFWENPDFNVSSDGDNAAAVESSGLVEIHNMQTGSLPIYKLRTLATALQHDTFKINGVQFVLFQNNITIDYKEPVSGFGRLNAQIRVKDFDVQNGSC